MPTFLFTNTEAVFSQMQPFLESKEYFGLERNEATMFIVKGQSLSGVLKIFLLITSGYLYDMIGRRAVIFICFLLIGTCVILIPHTGPNLNVLQVVFVFWATIFEPLIMNPLIPDYVDPASLGRGVALFQIGINSGTLLANLVMIDMTKQFGESIGWGIAGGTSLLFCLVTLLMVVEP